MSQEGAEALLKKIRKLEGNRFCPNCNSESPTGLGFGNICVKFNTFVCDMCKTSHQAISHRCKSVSMSTWSLPEVQALTSAKGGGNDVARKTWLGSAPACGQSYGGGRRPKKGDKIDCFKQFVIDCYEHKRFFVEPQVLTQEKPQRNNKITERTLTPKPPSATEEQNHDFFGFDSQPSVTTSSSAGFDAFGTENSGASGSNSSWGESNGFDNFNTNGSSSSSSYSFEGFDAFGGSSSSKTQTQTTNSSSSSGNGSVFDFDSFSNNSTSHTNSAGGVNGHKGSSTQSEMNLLDDVFGSTSISSSSAPSGAGSSDVFGGSDLLTATSSSSAPAPSAVQARNTGLNGPLSQGQPQPRYGGGAAAISNIGGYMGGPGNMHMRQQQQHQQLQQQRGQFDFVGMSMQSELGGASQKQQAMQQQRSMQQQQVMQQPNNANPASGNGMRSSGMNGSFGGNMSGGMMGGMQMSRGMGSGGSAAISSMNGLVQQQTTRRNSKGFSSVNFPSAW